MYDAFDYICRHFHPWLKQENIEISFFEKFKEIAISLKNGQELGIFPQIGEFFFLKWNIRAQKSFLNQAIYVLKFWLLEFVAINIILVFATKFIFLQFELTKCIIYQISAAISRRKERISWIITKRVLQNQKEFKNVVIANTKVAHYTVWQFTRN